MSFTQLKKGLAFFATALTLFANAHADYCFEENYCDGKVIVGADFLYWRAFERGLEHCAFDTLINNTLTDGTIETIIRKKNNFHHEWHPGFRIGAGYISGDCWTAGILWTHFNSRSHHRHHHTENRIKWNLDFDTIDALVGYTLDSCYCFSVTPLAGVRGARIDQKLHFRPDHNRNKQDFWGVGPLVGVEALWKIGYQFSLYANAYVSWLYGNYRIRSHESNEFDDGTVFFEDKRHFDASQYVADASLGLQWEIDLCNSKVALRVGAEHHHYFDYNHLRNGDLILDGLSASAYFEF